MPRRNNKELRASLTVIRDTPRLVNFAGDPCRKPSQIRDEILAVRAGQHDFIGAFQVGFVDPKVTNLIVAAVNSLAELLDENEAMQKALDAMLLVADSLDRGYDLDQDDIKALAEARAIVEKSR